MDQSEPPPGSPGPVPDELPDLLVDAGLRAIFAAGSLADPRPASTGIPGRIGRYPIAGEIARGGVGVVLRGRDEEIGRDIAIKVLLDAHQGNAAMNRRLIEEARIGGQLQHPGILPVYELGLVGGERPYLTMKLVEGRTFAALLAGREHPGQDRLRFLTVLKQVCEAIAYAHSRGVIHRDLKPLNVMVGAFGEVQVMDWGLAKVIRRPPPGSEAGSEAAPPAVQARAVEGGGGYRGSISGSVMGTPAYMAPEQARGEVEDLDERADVFGLGAVLCEVLTGSPPYRGDSTREVLARAREGDLEDARARLGASGADPELVSLALGCLAADREARPRDAGAVAGSLRAYLESLEERARRAGLEAAEARVRALGERKARKLTLALGSIILAAVLIGGGAWAALERGRQSRVRAEEARLSGALQETESLLREAEAAGPADLGAWESAQIAARGARSLVTAGVGEHLARRAAELLSGVSARTEGARFLKRLEEIPFAHESYDNWIGENQDRAYAGVFRDYFKLDLEELEPEAAAARIRGTGLAEELGRFLVYWAVSRRSIEPQASERWQRLLRIASAADPEPERAALWEALGSRDPARLRELASSVSIEAAGPLTLNLLAHGLASTGEAEEARRLYLDALVRHPGDFWMRVNAGYLLVNRRPFRPEEAIPHFTAAMALRPSSDAAYAGLGIAYRRVGDHGRSIAVLRRALEIRPDLPRTLSTLGVTLFESGDLEGSEPLHRRLLSMDSITERQRAATLNNLGNIEYERGLLTEAVDLFRKSLELDPGVSRTHSNLGYVFTQLGRPREAAGSFREALRLDPHNLDALTNLGSLLLDEGAAGEACERLSEAVKLDAGHAVAHSLLGSALARQGKTEDAVKSYLSSLSIAPERGYSYDKLRKLTESGTLSRSGGAHGDLLRFLDRLLPSGRRFHPDAPALFVEAWCKLPDSLYNARVLRVAEVGVERTERSDPAAFLRLARVLSLVGRAREAVLAAEAGSRLSGAGLELRVELAAWRGALLPDLASYASIDAAVEALPPAEGLEARRERFQGFLRIAGGESAPVKHEYLEARLLQRAGRHQEAVHRLLAVLGRDRSAEEPFLALRKSLDAARGRERARSAFLEVTKGGELPRASFSVPPERPAALGSGGEARPPGGSVVLAASAFEHQDPRVRPAAARWQVRRAGAGYERDPAADIQSHKDLEALSLPPGLLLPGEEYRFRVAHLGSDGRWSGFSEERPLAVEGPALEVVPLDLSAHFNKDVVADPGDGENDLFDAGGRLLVVAGFDGRRADRPDVQGLPPGGRVGVHRLGGYGGPNAVQLSPRSTGSIRIEVPEWRYLCLRLLVSGADGDSSVPVALEFADGALEKRRVPCPDWFADPSPELAEAGALPVWNGMDRLHGDAIEDADDPALFEVLLPLPKGAPLRAVVLLAEEAAYPGPKGRFHLFAAAGVSETTGR